MISPYKIRQELLHEYLTAANGGKPVDGTNPSEFLLIETRKTLGNHLERIPGKLQEYGCEKEGQPTKDQTQHAYSNLSMEEVDMYYRVMLLRRSVFQELEKCHTELNEVDRPPYPITPIANSMRMYPIINKYVKCANIGQSS